MARAQWEDSSITAIQSLTGETCTVNSDILDVFQHIYTDLYATKTHATPLDLDLFLQPCLFPLVSSEDREYLNSSITIDELTGGLGE